MQKRLAIIHTVAGLPATFKVLCDELIPGIDLFHLVDESLLQNTIRTDNLSPTTMRRLVGYLASAEEAGADLILVTCSSLGPAVEMGRSLVNIPVFRIDEPMVELAVKTGMRIGVAATLRTTMMPTVNLIESKASAAGKKIQLTTKLCEGAFQAVISGDVAKHDAIVTSGLRELIDQSDVIVLAQASMARVADGLPEDDRRVPILSSPRLAVENLARFIAGM